MKNIIFLLLITSIGIFSFAQNYGHISDTGRIYFDSGYIKNKPIEIYCGDRILAPINLFTKGIIEKWRIDDFVGIRFYDAAGKLVTFTQPQTIPGTGDFIKEPIGYLHVSDSFHLITIGYPEKDAFIALVNDSIIQIHGDTITAIRNMFESYERLANRLEKADENVRAIIKIGNGLRASDEQWRRYNNAVKKYLKDYNKN